MSSTESSQCGAETRDGSPCERPPMDNGRCYHHGGRHEDDDRDAGGAPEGNSNSMTHGAHRKPEFLKSDIVDTSHEDTFHAAHEALCNRYERMHGHEPDFAIQKDLEEVALAYVKRDMIDAYAVENAADNSPLVEEQVIGQDEQGRPVRVTQENKLQSLWTDLRRETRLLMKDMGLYNDPDSQQAEANIELGKMIGEALQED